MADRSAACRIIEKRSPPFVGRSTATPCKKSHAVGEGRGDRRSPRNPFKDGNLRGRARGRQEGFLGLRRLRVERAKPFALRGLRSDSAVAPAIPCAIFGARP